MMFWKKKAPKPYLENDGTIPDSMIAMEYGEWRDGRRIATSRFERNERGGWFLAGP